MIVRKIWVGTLALAAGPALAAPPESPPTPPTPTVVKVQAGKPRLDGDATLGKSIAAAREVLAQTRDYSGFLVRQERVNGAMRPEQVAELRVRMSPKCVNVRVVKPDALRGEEISYMPERSRTVARFKPAGVEGVRGFQSQPIDSPKLLAHTRHPITEVGLAAVLDRVEGVVATEQAMGHPAAAVASEYTFAGKRVVKCELFADLAHPKRYAPSVAVYFDVETKLPVRFEARDAQGQLIEAQSYVGVKRNVGLGDPAFER